MPPTIANEASALVVAILESMIKQEEEATERRTKRVLIATSSKM